LVLADGFYEWQQQENQKQKQPYYFRLKDGYPFAFAGLWERWQEADGEAIESCTLLTTEANELMRPIHNRMPVILDPTSYDLWLNPQMKQRESLETLLRPYPTEEMTAYPVSKAVNKPVNDSAECTERIEAS
jgi:putative SOS response-associated peptidase YedK